MSEIELGAPNLLPVRMLNEFVFCPRLFYLEWVDGQWRGNDDTAEGDWVHRRVDGRRSPGRSEPDDEWPLESLSITVEDGFLGLAAVIDKVVRDGDHIAPVDHKRGHPRLDGSVWPADQIQIEAQGALLRAQGHACVQGWVYYAETHQRVSVPIDSNSDARVRATVEQARQVADRPVPPLPLEDSGRCLRCSLAPICMPDEVNALKGRRAALSRAILPRRPDQRPVYVTVPGAAVGVQHGQLVVRAPDHPTVKARLIDVSHVAVYGNVQVSTQALSKLWSSSIPVLWLSSGGWLHGWAAGQPMKNVSLRRSQAVPHLRHLLLAQGLVAGKIRNQRTLLRRNSKSGDLTATLVLLKHLADQCCEGTSNAELMGIEGIAAREYFEHFSSMLTSGDHAAWFAINGRNRRPPKDPLNAALSYAYSLLTKELVVACLSVGLDPHMGVLHADRYGRPSMALDLMEEFRPLLADSVVLKVFNTNELTADGFVKRAGAYYLTDAGRRTLTGAFERRLESEITHSVFGYRISYRRAIDVQVRLAAALLVGEIDEYRALVTR